MDHVDRPVDRFLAAVASENLTPAGGTAAAVVGATGAALCEMVCIHSIERLDDEAIEHPEEGRVDDAGGRRTDETGSTKADESGDRQPREPADRGTGSGETPGSELAAVRVELEGLRSELLELAGRDSEVVTEMLSGSTVTDAETKRATGVPLAAAEACLSVLEHAAVVTAEGNRNAVPDAVTGAFLAHAALRSCVYIVRSNLERVEDRSFVDEMDRRTAELERSADRASERAMANAETRRPSDDN